MTQYPKSQFWPDASAAARLIATLPLALGLMIFASPFAHAEDAPAQAEATLTITFQGIKTPTGAMMVALAASPEAYADKAELAGQAIAPVSGPTTTTTFAHLKPGRYAVKVFHDINSDGKLNMNPFGMPTEPLAFSNNAHGTMGPADWSAAAFEVKAGANTQTIDID